MKSVKSVKSVNWGMGWNLEFDFWGGLGVFHGVEFDDFLQVPLGI